jgi:dipeptide transport system substrate-binding protein
MRQKDPQHPYHNVSGGSYSNFESLEFGQLITAIDKPDEYTVRFTLARAEAPFVRSGVVFRLYFIGGICGCDAESRYAAARRLDPIGTGPFKLAQYQKDSRILYTAFPDYWQGKAKSIVWFLASPRMPRCAMPNWKRMNAR